MRVITANVNGVRSAAQKGFFDWLTTMQADVICLQEIKAHPSQLADPVFSPLGYHCYYHPAEKPGYSGVGIYTKQLPQRIHNQVGIPWADSEGRYLQIDFDRYSVASIYLPSGSSSELRQVQKIKFLEAYLPILTTQRQEAREYILCGDWNIAHKIIDIKNWRTNQKNSGFLPEERAWLDQVFDELGYVDAFRVVNADPDEYTWWSFRGRAYEKNVGWRIDYQIVTPGLADKIQHAFIDKSLKFSDHAPVIVDYDLA